MMNECGNGFLSLITIARYECTMEELIATLMQYPYAGLFALLIFGVVLPLPEEATLILCGVLIARNVIEPAPGLACVYAGLLSSDLLIYMAGRTYGRRILSHPRVRRLLPEETRTRIELKFRKYGLFLIIVGRHIIGFRAKLFLVAGLSGISPVRFVLVDALAAFISMALMVSAGYTGNNHVSAVQNIMQTMPEFALPLAVFAALLILACTLRRKNGGLTARRAGGASPD